MPASPAIALTGLKHVGKSSIGRALSQALEFDFVDLDDLLVRRAVHENLVSPGTGYSDVGEPQIRHVYRRLGSSAFGAWEAEAIRDIPRTHPGASIILATGGGVCDHTESMRLIAASFRVLYLRNDPIVLYERAVSRGLPAFLDQARPREHFLEIARRRDALYQDYADCIVDVAGLSVQDAVIRIISNYAG